MVPSVSTCVWEREREREREKERERGGRAAKGPTKTQAERGPQIVSEGE